MKSPFHWLNHHGFQWFSYGFPMVFLQLPVEAIHFSASLELSKGQRNICPAKVS